MVEGALCCLALLFAVPRRLSRPLKSPMSHLDSLLSRSKGVVPMRQIPLDLGPETVPTLDDVVPGPNADVLAWLRDWPACR